MFLMFIITSCENNEEPDKYGMSRLEENVYQLENVEDITLKNDIFYYSVGDSIYSSNFSEIENDTVIIQSNTDITAIFAEEDIIWYACVDGSVGNYHLKTHEKIKYDIFSSNSDIECLVVNNGNLLMIKKELGEVYWETHVYLYDTTTKQLNKLTDTILPKGYYHSAGFIDNTKMYFISNNIPNSDFTTFIICDNKKIYTNKKIVGPFYNGEFNNRDNILYYIYSGNIYKYEIGTDNNSVIGAVKENLINKIFITQDNIITFNRKNSIIEVSLIPHMEDTIKIIIPDDSGESVIYYKLTSIAEKYKIKTGKTLEIIPLEKRGYLDRIRLLLLNKDSSFDLFYIPDGRDEQILHTLINYNLYIPLDNLPTLKKFFDTDCYDYMKAALSDKNGNIFGIPFTSFIMTVGYGSGIEKYRSDQFTFDTLYDVAHDILLRDNVAMFWSDNSARLIFEHLLSQLLEQNLPDCSEDKIKCYLELMLQLNNNNKLTGKNYVFEISSLFSSLNDEARKITEDDVVTFPSIEKNQKIVPCVNTEFILCSPNTNNIEMVDDFMTFLVENYVYDAHYFNGLIGKSLDKYSNAVGNNPFKNINQEPYLHLDFPQAYTQMYHFDEFEDIFYQAINGSLDIDSAVNIIFDLMKKWVFE